MLICTNCQSQRQFGAAYAGPGGNCQACQRDTDRPNKKLCDACSLKLDECQFCKAPAQSGRRPRLAASISVAQRRLAATEKRAQKVHDAAIAPFKPELAVFQSENQAASDQYSAAIEPFQTAAQEAGQKYILARKGESDGDAVALLAARDEADKTLRAEVEKASAALRLKMDTAGAKFAPHWAAWDAVEKTHRTATWRAQMLFNARIRQLGGHFAVDVGYKHECQRVMSQEH